MLLSLLNNRNQMSPELLTDVEPRSAVGRSTVMTAGGKSIQERFKVIQPLRKRVRKSLSLINERQQQVWSLNAHFQTALRDSDNDSCSPKTNQLPVRMKFVNRQEETSLNEAVKHLKLHYNSGGQTQSVD